MPEINSIYVFDKLFKDRLKQKFEIADMSHTNWGDDDIEDIRISIRDFYRIAQKGLCCYCRTNISLRSASNSHIEHIAPKSRYKQFIAVPNNLCVACADCNETKGSSDVFARSGFKRYPSKSEAFLIYHPHFDNFDDHFENRVNVFIGLTRKGEYTILLCDINRVHKRFRVPPPDPREGELHDLFFRFMSETDFYKKMDLQTQLRDKLS